MSTLKVKFFLTPTISFEQALIDQKAGLGLNFVALTHQIENPISDNIKEKYFTIHVPVDAIISHDSLGSQVDFVQNQSGQAAKQYIVELQNTECFLVDYSTKNDPQLNTFSVSDFFDSDGALITQNPKIDISKGVSSYNTTSSVPPHVGNTVIILP